MCFAHHLLYNLPPNKKSCMESCCRFFFNPAKDILVASNIMTIADRQNTKHLKRKPTTLDHVSEIGMLKVKLYALLCVKNQHYIPTRIMETLQSKGHFSSASYSPFMTTKNRERWVLYPEPSPFRQARIHILYPFLMRGRETVIYHIIQKIGFIAVSFQTHQQTICM